MMNDVVILPWLDSRNHILSWFRQMDVREDETQ